MVGVMTSFAVYAFVYIWRMSFLVNGVRYFTLADDQMVSMRYAENLARGYGLVWNPGGARVEGYTNFTWMLYMALFHWLSVPRHFVSVCIELSGAASLLINLIFVRRLALRLADQRESVAFIAVALTAFYIPLDNWAFQGTEVGLLTLMVSISAWLAVEVLAGSTGPGLLYLLLGVTTTVRPDMVVFDGLILVGLALLQPAHWRRHLGTGGGILVGFLLIETAWRMAYFHYPLPNTYYLKVTGYPLLPRITRGLLVAFAFLVETLPVLVILGLGQQFLRRKRELRLLISVVVGQFIYSVGVGGDAWEWWGGANRFVAIVMPLLFVCVAVVANELIRGLSFSAPRSWAGGHARSDVAVAVALVIATNLLALSTFRPVARMLLIERPLESQQDEANVRAALRLKAFTDPAATIGVTWAGAIPYFSERHAIDLLGKTDTTIAHGPMHVFPGWEKWTSFLPGHLKWDYNYSILQLKPDVIQAPLWRLSYRLDRPERYLAPGYSVLVEGSQAWYVRNDSLHVHWGGAQ